MRTLALAAVIFLMEVHGSVDRLGYRRCTAFVPHAPKYDALKAALEACEGLPACSAVQEEARLTPAAKNGRPSKTYQPPKFSLCAMESLFMGHPSLLGLPYTLGNPDQRVSVHFCESKPPARGHVMGTEATFLNAEVVNRTHAKPPPFVTSPQCSAVAGSKAPTLNASATPEQTAGELGVGCVQCARTCTRTCTRATHTQPRAPTPRTAINQAVNIRTYVCACAYRSRWFR